MVTVPRTASVSSLTGPISPAGWSVSPAFQNFHAAKVTRRGSGRGKPFTSHSGRTGMPPSFQFLSGATSSGKCSSPINRLTQVVVTSISSSFFPSRRAPVTSNRKGGFQQSPRACPLSRAEAITATSPRSRYIRDLRLEQLKAVR